MRLSVHGLLRRQPADRSHHLRVLREAGWIVGERRGTWVWYSLRSEAVARFRDLAGTFGPSLPMPSSRRLPVIEARA